MTEPEQRTPKQDRSRLTRERLLGASIDLLATQGWAATTVGAVAAAAGVSRGAAQHHFPTREDLITAALGHMIEQRIEDVRRVGLDLGEDLVLTRRLGLSLAELERKLGKAEAESGLRGLRPAFFTPPRVPAAIAARYSLTCES